MSKSNRWVFGSLICLLAASGCEDISRLPPRVATMEGGEAVAADSEEFAELQAERNKLAADNAKLRAQLDKLEAEQAKLMAAQEKPTVAALREVAGENNFANCVMFNDAGQVTRVDLTDIPFPDSQVAIFQSLPKLERLALWGAGITDASMDDVAKLTQITHLTLFNTEITGDGVAKLKPLARNLKSLNLRRSTHVRDDDLAHLLSFNQLVQLDLLYNNFTDEALMHVAKLPQLQSLDLRGCVQIGTPGIEKIAGLKQLKAIKLFGYSIDDRALEVIGNFKQMKVMYLEGASVTDEGLKHLAGLTNMEDLTIFGIFGITDAGLSNLKGMTKMRVLSLRGTPMQGPGLSHLAAMSELQALDLSETAINDEALAVCKHFPQLEQLDLWHTQVTDAGMKQLVQLKHLKELNLEQNQITNEGLKTVGEITSLENLNLKEAKIDDAGLVHLESLKNLKKLSLANISVSPEAVAKLKTALPDLKEVKL